MNLGFLRTAYNSTKQFTNKNISHILMAIGTGCSLSALISAIRSIPEMHDVLYFKRVEKTAKRLGVRNIDIYDQKPELDELTKFEIVKAYVECYGLCALLELVSLLCFWGAHGIDIHRQVVLAGVAATAEEALHEYQRKVKQLIGEKAEKEVQTAIAQDKVDNTPAPKNTVILDGDAEMWFLIGSPPQRFKQTYTGIKDTQNDINWEMIQHLYASESDLFELLDPNRRYLKRNWDSGEVGWSCDKMLVLDIDCGFDPDHKPVGVISYKDKDGFRYDPQPGYSKSL